MKQVTIYTDGACSGNPGPGGWGAILEYAGTRKEMSGGAPETTNNRMELTGVIATLSALKEPCQVSLYTDAQYIVNAVNQGWLRSWQAKNWKKKGGDVKNPDLWQQLLPLLARHDVHFFWVKGHAENPWNNRCDELAVEQSRQFQKK